MYMCCPFEYNCIKITVCLLLISQNEAGCTLCNAYLVQKVTLSTLLFEMMLSKCISSVLIDGYVTSPHTYTHTHHYTVYTITLPSHTNYTLPLTFNSTHSYSVIFKPPLDD